MPPVGNQEETSEAKIVSEFAKEFNVDEVYNSESSFIGSLKFDDDFNPVEVPSSGPLNFDENMLEFSISANLIVLKCFLLFNDILNPSEISFLDASEVVWMSSSDFFWG